MPFDTEFDSSARRELTCSLVVSTPDRSLRKSSCHSSLLPSSALMAKDLEA